MFTYENTQLSSAVGFDPTKIVFQEPQPNSLTLGDGKKINYFRIPVAVRNNDGTIGELVFSTERLVSYGVQENKNMETGRVDGYSAALCMWNRDGATESQKGWIEGFSSAIERCKNHVLHIKDDIEKYDLESSDLKKFNPLYWKKEKGKVIEGRGPTLYPKLITSRKENPPKILTPFYDEQSQENINPLTLIGKYCYMTAAIKVESIFVGARISPQVKLYEAEIKLAQSKNRRLLKKDHVIKKVSHEFESNTIGVPKNNDNDDAGSIGSDDSPEPETKPAPTTTKKIVKKVVRRKKVVTKPSA